MNKTILNQEEFIDFICLGKVEVFNFDTNESIDKYKSLQQAYSFHGITGSGHKGTITNSKRKNGTPIRRFSRKLGIYIYFKSIK